jgi:hypothetical protein
VHAVLAFLIGVVAGLRAMTPPAAISWAARFGWLNFANTPIAFLAFSATPYILSVFAIGELINDKLPKTPSRKALAPFAVRIGVGGDAQRAQEKVAQLLATLHLTARDRFRLIVQRIDVERETPLARLVDDSQLLGSLLFTHERSLTRRVYAGVSFARGETLDQSARETLEVFVKLQWGFSSARGFRM